MADVIDQMADNDAHTKQVEANIARAREAAAAAPRQYKYCLNCAEPTEGAAFCDKDCQEDYEKVMRAKRLSR